MSWDELADGVYRRRYPELDQNIGLVVGSEDVLVIDSRSHPHHARVLEEEIAHVSRLPIRWLINTHWHWDHCFGNAVFSDAVVVGHELCRRGLVERGPDQLNRLRSAEWFPEVERPWLDEVEIVPPTLTFEDRTSLWAAGRRLDLSYHGRGHTDADIVIQVDGVTFVGDLVEEGAPPAFGDSYLEAWVATLHRIQPMLTGVVVPGHGDVVTSDFVAAQADEIDAAVSGADRPYPPAVMEEIAKRVKLESS